MPEAGNVVVNIDISQLVDIGNNQLQALQDMNDLLSSNLSYQSALLETANNILLAALVVLGAVLGAVIFRHLRK